MPIKQTVYDKETGHTHEMWGVDAHEAVKNDPRRYSLGKPAGWSPGKPLINAKADPPKKEPKQRATRAPEPEPKPAPVADQTEPNE